MWRVLYYLLWDTIYPWTGSNSNRWLPSGWPPNGGQQKLSNLIANSRIMDLWALRAVHAYMCIIMVSHVLQIINTELSLIVSQENPLLIPLPSHKAYISLLEAGINTLKCFSCSSRAPLSFRLQIRYTWGGTIPMQCNLDKILRLQKRAARILFEWLCYT